MPKPFVPGVVVSDNDLNSMLSLYTPTDGGTVDVVSSTTETALMSETILGGDMGIARAVTVLMFGDFLNNDGADRNFTLRIKYGGTTHYGDQAAIGTAATRRGWKLEFTIANIGADDAQFAIGTWMIGGTTAGSVNGIGPIDGGLLGGTPGAGAAGQASVFSSAGLSAVDTSADKTLEVTVELGTNSANLSFRKHWAAVTLL